MKKGESSMKKLALLTVLVLMIASIGVVQAEIIEPRGYGQIGLQAVVLCEQLSLREGPSASSDKVRTLTYGDRPIVIEQSNGWASVTLGDSEDSPVGWVNADYLAVDPAWVRTEEKTPVYAWDDTLAPKVALLDADTTLPILADEGAWLIISLRGAVGWIQK